MAPSVTVRFLNRGGRWQTKQLVVLLLGYFATGFQSLVIVFIGFQPNFTCKDNSTFINGSSSEYFDNKCYSLNISTTCTSGFEYDVGKHESIVSDWDLICHKAYLSETSQLLYTIGMAVGSVFVSPIPDRFGRKWSYIVLRFMFILCTFGLAAVPNVIWFMALRFLSGMIGKGLSLVRFVYLMELSPGRHRPLVCILTGFLWALSLCLEALIAHLMRGYPWRIFQTVVSIPTITVFLDLIFLKESLLWLSTNNKEEITSRLLTTAMANNRLTVDDLNESIMDQDKDGASPTESASPKDVENNGMDDAENEMAVASDLVEPIMSGYDREVKDSHPDNDIGPRVREGESAPDVPLVEECRSESENEKRKVSILDILKNSTTRAVTALICITWCVNSLVYYGIFFMSSEMAGDRILNFFLSALVEIPSNAFLYFCLKYFRRRRVLIGLHSLCALFLLLGGIFIITLKTQVKYIIMQIVTIIGKFGISTTYSMIYIYTTEVFPTNFRTSGMGLGSASARLGSFMSPFTTIVARELPWGPGIIFGGLCLIVTILMFWAPETRDKTLPQSIAEVEVLTNSARAPEPKKNTERSQ